jgi:hypothetical protein
MLGLIGIIIILTLVAGSFYFLLPRRYRWVLTVIAFSCWYVDSLSHGQLGNLENGRSSYLTYDNQSEFSCNNESVERKISEKDVRHLEIYGSNNRQRFRNLTNIRLSENTVHGLNKHNLFLKPFAVRHISFRNFIIQDRYISFLVKLKE